MSTQSIPFSRSFSRASGSWLLGLGLAFGLFASGDHSVWSAGAGNTGVDPLEILNLSVRPNAIFVLDSSGSMGQTLGGDAIGADHQDSKLAIAKSVINQVVSANQTRVSFQFGKYSQGTSTLDNHVITDRTISSTRFEYTTLADPPFTTEPSVQLRLFEVPAGSNWTVSFTNGATIYTTTPIPAGVYTGTELAERIATLMNAQHSASYTGTFSDPATSTSPAFTFTRGTGTAAFSIRFQVMDATLRDLLRAVSTESNAVNAPFSIQPHVGSFTTGGGMAGPNSFSVSGGPTISFAGGATSYSGTLTNGTYTGQQLADHIASRMNALDTGATVATIPNSFTITGRPQIRIRRGGSNFTGFLDDGTYTGQQLADHIADVMDQIDTASSFQANYSGTYNTSNGIFTFTRSGSITNQSFRIRWGSWDSNLRDLIGAPSSDATDSNSPYILSTNGVSLLTQVRTYDGSYNASNGVFTFNRTGSNTANFSINWGSWTSSLRTLIGTPSSTATDTTAPYSLSSSGKLVSVSSSTQTSNGPSNSTAPLVLFRRADSSSYQVSSDNGEYYQLFANKFFNGQTLSVLPDGTPCYLTNGTATADPQITIQIKNTCSGAVTDTVAFPAAGSNGFDGISGNGSCKGFDTLVGLSDCNTNDQLSTIGYHLQRELAAPGGVMPGYSESPTGQLISDPVVTGVRAAGNTPIAESLIDLRTIFTVGIGAQPATPFVLPLPSVRAIWPVVATQTKKQSTFIIFLTDGDDTCQADQSSGGNGDNNALRAAHKAEQLYKEYVTGQPASSVTTFVVTLGSGASANRSNWIAWGGSGMHITASGSDTLESTRWNSIPTQAQRDACTTCRDAFLASDASSLTEALQAAIDLGQSAGEFSDQQSITETVYEYVGLAPSPTPIASPSPTTQPSPFHPLNPITRYGSTIPVLLQSTFELPTFTGHLKAFRNNAGASEQLWDAGAKLKTRVVDDTGAMGTGTYSFQALYGNGRSTPIKTSNARIKRRIYSTARQGVLSGYTAQNLLSDNASILAGPLTSDPTRVDLWPPSEAVAPAGSVSGNNADIGILDAAMGLLTPTTVAQVQSLVTAACVTSGDAVPVDHPDCVSNNANRRLAQARKEAREIMLAFIAGAKLAFLDGAPRRDSSTGELLYVARPWIMAESTLAAPAVVTPPLLSPTLNYKRSEYLLYRDGPRDGAKKAVDATQNGLGLRNPDLENPQTATARDNNDLKPQMSVVYHATNLGLHAFRAGPCPTTGVSGGLFGAGSLGCSGETGGEELWAFVPFDQLAKLPQAQRVQSRANKTYLLASPVRITDVFVNGGASTTVGAVNVSVTGVWRTLAVFGRGAGGKGLTAMDVTVPGPFTRNSLTTNPPIIVWSRGNYDTTDGLVKTGANSYVHDSADYTAYLSLGETWSVPAVGFVDPVTYPTSRKPTGVEFVAFMGSGFSDSSTEGKTFYALDLLTGDVIRNFTIPNGTTNTTISGSPLRTVIAGSPSVYAVDDAGNSPAGFGFLSNPVEAKAKFVYFGDLHSRVWRYVVATPAVAPVVVADVSGDGDQPFSNAISVIESAKVPNLFFSGGRDSRVLLRTVAPRFRMYGYTDATGSSPAGPVTQLFARDFPATYRGNSAPAAAFVGGDTDNNPMTPPVYTPVVFFTGLAAASLAGEPCTSSFDSVLFALQGQTGLAAFDLNSQSNLESDDAFAVIRGQVLQNPHVTSEGTIVIDRGLGAQVAPPPPAAPVTAELPPQTETTSGVYPGLTPGSPAYAALRPPPVPYRSGTAVCNVK